MRSRVYTEEGKKRFCKFLRYLRESHGPHPISQENLVAMLSKRTGIELDKNSVQRLEIPSWGAPASDTLLALVASGFLRCPATGKAFDLTEVNEIIIGNLDPMTGEEIPPADPLAKRFSLIYR